MSSSSTLPSKYFNRLQANRLEAQNSYIINYDKISFLYSLLLKSATFNKNNTGGTLTFSSGDVDSVIEFTDRPFRQTDNNYSIDNFIDLFSIVGNNSFKVDPPNGVLVSSEEQKTYELKTAKSDGNGKYTIELELIDGESNVGLGVVSGRFSLFVDNSGATSHSGGATSQSGGATSQSGGATSQSGGATSQSGGATSQSGGATSQYVKITVPFNIKKSNRSGYTYMLTFPNTAEGNKAFKLVINPKGNPPEFITSLPDKIYKMGNNMNNWSGNIIYSDITYNGSKDFPDTSFSGPTYWKYI